MNKSNDALVRLKDKGLTESPYSYSDPCSTERLSSSEYVVVEKLSTGKDLLDDRDIRPQARNDTINFHSPVFQSSAVQIGSNNRGLCFTKDIEISKTASEIQALPSKLEPQVEQSDMDRQLKLSLKPSIDLMKGVIRISFIEANVPMPKLREIFNLNRFTRRFSRRINKN